MKGREFFYISNVLSITRVVLLVPLIFFFRLESTTGNYLAVFTILLAAITDFFDGRLARKYNQTSDLGRVLDPVADKICVAGTALLLIVWRDLPLWYIILLVVRDVGILILGVSIVVKTKVMVESNWTGKVTVGALVLVLLAFTLELDMIKWEFLWISVVLVTVSSLSYLIRMIEVMRSDKLQR